MRLFIITLVLFFYYSLAFANENIFLCKKLNGSWEDKIQAKVITFKCDDKNKLRLSVYQYTQNACILQQEPEILTNKEIKTIHFRENDEISIGNDIYSKTNVIPFEKPVPPGTAFENCHILVENFREHYGFFELRQVDFHKWKQQCVNSIYLDSHSDEFLKLLTSMLDIFQDNHIMLAKNIKNEIPDYFGFNLQEPFNSNLMKEVKQYNLDHGLSLSNSDYIDQVLTPEIRHYLLNKVNPIMVSQKSIFWGPLKNDQSIVYFYISSMEINENEIKNLTHQLDNLVEYVKKYRIRGIIIDVRFNQGGNDIVGNIIMSYFIDSVKTAYWKQFFYEGMNWTQPQPFSIEPSKKHTNIPIVLLVSPLTASAAESFALSMLSLPQVKLIGDRTMGIFSDQLPRRLPNGCGLHYLMRKYCQLIKKFLMKK